MNIHLVPSHHVLAELARHETQSLRQGLLPAPPTLPLKPVKGDFDLNPSLRDIAPNRQLAPAAVLVPIIAGPNPRILFTRRSAHLSRHAGQVSFPGGRADPTDDSLVHTALRETQEETGISPEFVSIAGFLDPYETGTGFAILPVVGVLREGFTITPYQDEVEEIFDVPLSFLLDPANRLDGEGHFQGHKRFYYSYAYQEHRIWGATAGMLANLAARFSI